MPRYSVAALPGGYRHGGFPAGGGGFHSYDRGASGDQIYPRRRRSPFVTAGSITERCSTLRNGTENPLTARICSAWLKIKFVINRRCRILEIIQTELPDVLFCLVSLATPGVGLWRAGVIATWSRSVYPSHFCRITTRIRLKREHYAACTFRKALFRRRSDTLHARRDIRRCRRYPAWLALLRKMDSGRALGGKQATDLDSTRVR